MSRVLEPHRGDIVLLPMEQPVVLADAIGDVVRHIGRQTGVSFVLVEPNGDLGALDGDLRAEIAARQRAAAIAATPRWRKLTDRAAAYAKAEVHSLWETLWTR